MYDLYTYRYLYKIDIRLMKLFEKRINLKSFDILYN